MSDLCYATSQEAERAFYDAFERADVDDMMTVWADEDAIVCIHPMGPRHQGRDAVARSWQQIFAGGAGMRFDLSEISTSADDSLAVHCVYENISHGEQIGQRSRVLATNIYKRTDRGWRMLVHHASPGSAPHPAREEPHSTIH